MAAKSLPVKAVLIGICVVAAAVILAPPPKPLAHNPQRKPVYFWHMWSGEWQPVVENICRRFNASQDKYEVIPLQVPADGAETKFLLSAAGGSAPDLVSQWNPVLGMWSDRGLIRPLDELMTPAEVAGFQREAYPIMRKHAMYKGRIMALIAGVDVGACYYRLDHLKEIGLDEHHLPKTLEELTEVGHKLDRFDAQGHLRRIGFMPQGFENFAPSYGGTFNDENGPLLGTEPQRAALRYIVENYRKLGFDQITRYTASLAKDSGANAPIIAGNYSIMLDGQWRVKQNAQFAPDLPYCVAPLPPPKGGRAMASFTAANYMMVPRAAHNPEGGLAFLKFWIGMGQPEAGAQNVVDMGWLPYSDKVAKTSTYQAYLAKYPQFAPFVQLIASPYLEIPPSGPLQSFIMNEIQTANDLATRGTLTADQAIDQMVRNVKNEIERQRRLGRG